MSTGQQDHPNQDASSAPLSESERATLVEAWVLQTTEWTKSIFAISSAAIGLIVTSFFSAPKMPPESKIFLVCSAVLFATAILSCLSAFLDGADLIKAMLTSDGRETENGRAAQASLARLKEVQYAAFVLGLGTLLVAAVLYLIQKHGN